MTTTTVGTPGSCDVPQGTVELTITQQGRSASYTDDAGAMYDGTVCGTAFSFKGGLTGSYQESGKFTLNSDGTAGKVSSYTPLGGACTGRCIDELTRQ